VGNDQRAQEGARGRAGRRRGRWAGFAMAAASGAALVAAGLPGAAWAQAASSFQLERDGEPLGLFETCRGLGSENEVVEFQVVGPGGVEMVRKRPGRLRHLDVVCTRGASGSTALSDWRAQIEAGDTADAFSALTVTELDAQATPVRVFRLVEAWPVEVQVVGGSGGSVELVRIAHEGITRDR